MGGSRGGTAASVESKEQRPSKRLPTFGICLYIDLSLELIKDKVADKWSSTGKNWWNLYYDVERMSRG